MFVWNGEGGSLNETNKNQVENMKYGPSRNHRGFFFPTQMSNEPAHLLAAHICSKMWEAARIDKVVVLIPNKFAYRQLHAV